MFQQNFKSRQSLSRRVGMIVLFVLSLIVGLFVPMSELTAQTGKQPAGGQILSAQQEMSAVQRAQLLQFAQEQGKKMRTERAEAEVLARRLNLPIRRTFPNGGAMELQRFENGMPIYYVTSNLNAARTISTDRLWSGGGAGLSLTGTGQTLGIWDAGAVRATHQEFGGRVTQSDGATSLHWHATHVAGTMIAAGVNANAQGMASGALLQAYDWNSDVSEMATAAANGLRVSNHSYGQFVGWDWNRQNANNWSWNGNTSVNANEDFQFGFYDAIAQSMDNVARTAPFYLIVWAAANDRNNTGPLAPNTNHFDYVLASGWVLQTDGHTHNADGAPNGYDTVHDAAVAKNVLTVGAVDDIPGGYTNSTQVVQINTNFSSWGPTDDGRIKPDIVANGDALWSTDSPSDNAYNTLSGTSMATPNVSGSIGLLWQHLRNLYGANANFLSSTMKALIIHTADEAGPNPGPDYQFGWGLMNTQTAAQVMSLDAAAGGNLHISVLTMNQGGQFQFQVNSDGTKPLRATICWTDLAATPLTWQLDPTNSMLVNDLDLRIIRDSDGQVFSPWVLNVANPAAAATQADNAIDNVEQVLLANPVAGSYTVSINHKGVLQGGAQQFSLLVTGQPPTNPPNAPSNLTATAVSQYQIDLAWTDNSLDENGSRIEQKVGLNGTYTQIATNNPNITSFTQYGLTGGTTYYYRVRAYNSLGYSAYSNEASATTPLPPPPAMTFNPTADNYVKSDEATSNFGTASTLRVRQSSTILYSYLKFVVSGVSGAVQSATLRLKVTAAGPDGGIVYSVSNNYLNTSTSWIESGLNYANAPSISGDPLSSAGSVLVNQVVVFDVTAAISGNGTYSFGLKNYSSTVVQYSSKEGSIKPELVIQTGGAPPPTPSLSIDDVSVTEGNSGTVNANFTVSLSAASSQVVTVNYATANGTATAGSDYTAITTTLLSFPAGTTTQPITVAVNGDGDVEGDETFVVNLSNATNATIADPQGQCTINNDDASGSPFTDINASLIAVDASSVWGDYDNDGDLDILLTGNTNFTGSFAKIYRNNGSGSFTVDATASSALAGVYNSSVSWGDYDNDGDLDILLIGNSGAGLISRVYKNNGSSFSDLAAGLPGVDFGSAAWGDYDNDGDLDILLTGDLGSVNRIARVYKNNGNDTFTDINATALLGVTYSSVAWGDYDNDGDLDILLTGKQNSGVDVAKIYRNDVGSFLDSGVSLQAVSQSSVAWGDYDNDGDLDILLAGAKADGQGTSIIYQNNGNGSFADISAALPAFKYGSVAWGDYDNDGKLDILSTGGSQIAKVYRNNGSGSFVDSGASLTGVYTGSAVWGDYDNDGDLDILLTGFASASTSIVYKNNTITANTAPAAPANLIATVSGSSVTFSWNKATDSQTPQNGLTYNLRLGTAAGGAQKLSPMANVSNGYRRVPRLGNTNHRASWTIKNVPSGTYFWSVQAIDHAFAGSAFAGEKSFAVTPSAPTNLALNKPATASSTTGTNSANKAVDGSTSTYWESGSVSSTAVAWYRVDLGTTQTVARVVVKWEGSYYAKKYDIQISTNDATWTTVYTDNAGNGKTDDISFAAASARYVRLYNRAHKKSTDRVDEIEVYASPGSAVAKQDDGDSEIVEVPIPTEIALHQNYPNPFNPSTTISFSLPEEAHVTLKIYNAIGEQVATLVDEQRNAGIHKVVFEARTLASGVYFTVFNAGDVRQVRRLMLLK